jgi:hypothetical protein
MYCTDVLTELSFLGFENLNGNQPILAVGVLTYPQGSNITPDPACPQQAGGWQFQIRDDAGVVLQTAPPVYFDLNGPKVGLNATDPESGVAIFYNIDAGSTEEVNVFGLWADGGAYSCANGFGQDDFPPSYVGKTPLLAGVVTFLQFVPEPQ